MRWKVYFKRFQFRIMTTALAVTIISSVNSLKLAAHWLVRLPQGLALTMKWVGSHGRQECRQVWEVEIVVRDAVTW